MISHQNLVQSVEEKKTIWKKRIYERVFNFSNKIDLEKIIKDTMMINRQYVAFWIPIDGKYRYIISDEHFWDAILSIFKNKLDNNFYIEYSDRIDKKTNRLVLIISWDKPKSSSTFTNFLKQLFD